MPRPKKLTVRFCTWCEMFHEETAKHLTDKQKRESLEYDVYHANGSIYFSEEHVSEES